MSKSYVAGIVPLGLLAAATVPLIHAQLAITEVLSSGSKTLGTNALPESHPDFWELTNFGTNTIDLSDYRFNDQSGIASAHAEQFAGHHIGPGETIIFSCTKPGVCENAAQFRAWWGETNLPSSLEVYFYSRPGFNKQVDAVQLWCVSGGNIRLVQRVNLGEARRGFTFTYDPALGEVDQLSEAGMDRAFKAAQSDDVGSPGFTVGPVPLAITQAPTNCTVDAGAQVIFTVKVRGLPKPRFQWFINGAKVAGAANDTFVVPVALPGDAGAYAVELDNGVEKLRSPPASLQVNVTPMPPQIVEPLADVSVTRGQTAVFEVNTRGYPLPTFQWQYNGVDIPGATSRTLSVSDADFDVRGVYCVRTQNALGSASACATLMVTDKPRLLVTEMMGGHSDNTAVTGHGDWWELTNFAAHAVNLHGYRFDDYPGDLEGAVVVTNDLVIQPGESILFIQDMTPEAFTSWWGEENLPAGVQFVSYVGNGFQASYDAIKLWNPTARKRDDLIASAEYVNLNPDSSPVYGVSLTSWCDGPIEFGTPSVLGQAGAIRAGESDDIGSPGYIANHPVRTMAPRCLQISHDDQGVHLVWKTQGGKRYELQSKDSLAGSQWTPRAQYVASATQLMTDDTPSADVLSRFYQLVVVPDP